MPTLPSSLLEPVWDQFAVVERTHAGMNGYSKLRRCTEKAGRVGDCHLFLAAALVVVRTLIQRTRHRYRWPTRPTTRRLK